ncbi:MAG: orc1/cdc6 family replication initiation protein [Candidatus Aenigmarchaeota archaeon]|nr:orc1/cdc6 family replication initiation protein [Candidatus Aenigmarchaeota archaeon]
MGSRQENLIFSQYLKQPTLFQDKDTLTANFIPSKIKHREQEIQQLSVTLAPALKGYTINNIFVYGTCGTGKTVCCKTVLQQLQDAAAANDKEIQTLYINCKMKRVADTEYRLFAQLIRLLGGWVPDTGLPTDVLYRRFFEMVDSTNKPLIIILDEIDTLINKIGDEFLYNLSRINIELKNTRITIIGITNNASFRDSLDQRVKSSLGEEEILFKPYNATQLHDILAERTLSGFGEGVVLDEAVGKCAALAAQEHGDARRALDLLRVAGEIAERMGDVNVTETHVDLAEEKINLERIVELIKSQPLHSQLVLHVIITQTEKQQDAQWTDRRILSGDIFHHYNTICTATNIKPLTQRRVSDLVAELDMLGVIATRVISKGRYGRTREISLSLSGPVREKTRKILVTKFG